MFFILVLAAIVEYHKLGSISNRYLFLTVLKPVKSEIRVPTWSSSEPTPSAVKAWSPNHWTAREVPRFYEVYIHLCVCMCRYVYLHWWLSGKQSVCNARDVGSTPGSGRCPGEGTGHSSILAWRIPQIEEPGRLRSVGLQRVGHN